MRCQKVTSTTLEQVLPTGIRRSATTRKSIEIEYVVDTMLEENVHDILCSALVDDCIERAKSIKQGGAKYDWVSGLQVGIANLGNSLAAVKKLVFDQGVIGQQELAKALAEDFEGLTHEQLRQRLINGAPKYGNDEDSVDMLLARAYQTYIDELKLYHNPRYGRGPIGGNCYAGTRPSPPTCRLARRPWRRRMAVKRTRRWRKGARPPVPTISGRPR